MQKTSHWQEQLRTISSVITAFCLVFISVSLITTGVYVVRTLSYAHETYHPEQLGSMLSDIGDTVSTIHKTTHLLGSGNMQPLIADFHSLIVNLQQLGVMLEKLHVDKILQESEKWRNMSTTAMIGLAKSFL